MKINEVAKLTGVTVRTLHYYDQIGLLTPSKVTEAGYRIYEEEDLLVLQQILFFKELDFPLKQIKEIMENPGYERREAFVKQKELLKQKRDRLNRLLALIDSELKGENTMDFQAFDQTELQKNREKYAKEVKERWGDTKMYKESEEKAASYSPMEWSQLVGEGNEILAEFGKNRMLSPDSEEAMALAKKWQDYLTKYYFHCTKEILSSLGLMYVADERFQKNIDKNGEGTAAFMSAAIAEYCKR